MNSTNIPEAKLPVLESQIIMWKGESIKRTIGQELQQTSPCNNFVARWFNCDEEKSDLRIYDTNSTLLFTLNRCKYYLKYCQFAVYFLPNPKSGEMLLLYHPIDGVLAIHNIVQNKEVVRTEKCVPMIFHMMKTSSETHLVVCGWAWHPFVQGYLLNLKDFLLQGSDYSLICIYSEQSQINGILNSKGVYIHSWSEDPNNEPEDLENPIEEEFLTWDEVEQTDYDIVVNCLLVQHVVDGKIKTRYDGWADEPTQQKWGIDEQIQKFEKRIDDLSNSK